MRKAVLFVMLMALLPFALTAAAQDVAAPFCGDLPESDCSILTNAQTTMLANQSGRFDLAINLTVSDIEGFNEPLIFNLSGTGAYSGNLSGMAGSSNLPMQTMTDPSMAVQMLGELLGGFSGELDLTLTVPQSLAGMMGETEGGIPLQLRLVDGVGYLNFDLLRDLLGAGDGQPEGWGGIDLVGLITQAANSGMLEGMDQTGIDTEAVQRFSDPAFFNQFVVLSRAADTTLENGANVAVFTTSVDYAALAQSEEFNELMQQSMEASGSSLTAEEMESASAMMGEMFQNITLSTTTFVGVDDNQVYRQQTVAVINLQGLTGAMGGEGDMAAPTLTLDATIDLSGFNEAQDIIAPEGAPVLTAEDLMGSGMGMQGGQGDVPAPTVPTVVVPTVVVPTVVVPTVVVPTVVVPTVVVPTAEPPATQQTSPGG
jgi:hypothetical protein